MYFDSRYLLVVGAATENLAILQNTRGACVTIPSAVHDITPTDTRAIGLARLLARAISTVDFLRKSTGDEHGAAQGQDHCCCRVLHVLQIA